jgi:hypothetical protein
MTERKRTNNRNTGRQNTNDCMVVGFQTTCGFYFCGVSVDSWLYGIVFFLAIQCLWKDDYILHVYKRGGGQMPIYSLLGHERICKAINESMHNLCIYQFYSQPFEKTTIFYMALIWILNNCLSLCSKCKMCYVTNVSRCLLSWRKICCHGAYFCSFLFSGYR